MFRKMLVCTDLSPASDALIQCVGKLKSLGMKEVALTHVIYVANTPGLEEMLAEDARPILERQKKLSKHKVSVSWWRCHSVCPCIL